ncbi:MAG: YafY family transcriptional regulator [Lachnospiraceae bacterium]|nr:YafY family transcriptional regulator [Lachnospiraceae bacterium]
MKVDRLIGILSILLQKDTVTAPYLAERFEVSRRTVNRDIEALCKAGIPIVTRQGTGGGISIMENYKMDKTLFTMEEMQDILAGLGSLDSVNKTKRYARLKEKLFVGASDFTEEDNTEGRPSVLIDLSSWYKDALAFKIERIRYGIDHCRELEFLYFAPGSESMRRIRPYYLVFRWTSWYVWGWCCLREDFRLFKLNRMEKLKLCEESFEKQKAELPDLDDDRIFPGKIQVKAIFDADCKWKLVEEYGLGCYEEQEDGRLLFHADYTNKENLISWLLAFGHKVRLLEPQEIREEMREIIEKMQRNYQ